MDDTERSRSADDRALDDAIYADLFDAMRAASSGPAPAMGPELSAILSGVGVASLRARRTRVRTAIVGLAVLGAVAGGAGAAAAAGVSPSHAARFATSIIRRMPGVDSVGDTGVDTGVDTVVDTGVDTVVDEGTTGTTEQRESPSPTSGQVGSDDEPDAHEDSPAQVSHSYRPSGAEAEDTTAGETSSTDASDDGHESETRSTDTDGRTAPSSTSTQDDAESQTSRDTDESSGTSQEQSDD
jgi:hypothetical protein